LEDAKAASVVENLHRNKMNTHDMSAACVFLAESVGKGKAAKSMGISTQTLRKYLGFAAVPEKLKQYVPKELSRDDATRLYQIISNVPKAVKIAEKVIPLDQKLRKEYLKALSKSPRSSHNKLLKISKSHMLQQRIKFEVTKGIAQKLKKHANQNDVNPDQMANKILSDWLKKR
jgi:ParB family chromosome partitioning protein